MTRSGGFAAAVLLTTAAILLTGDPRIDAAAWQEIAPGRSAADGAATGIDAQAPAGISFPPAAADTEVIRVAAGDGPASDRLDAALAQARALRHSGKAATILLAPGTYRLTRSLALGAADSGTSAAPLRIVGDPAGPVVLTATAPASPAALPAEIANRLPAAARGRVAAFALSAAMADAYAGRRRQPYSAKPAPAAILPLSGGVMDHASWPDQGYSELPKASAAQAGTLAIPAAGAAALVGAEALDAEGYFTADFAWERVPVATADAGSGSVTLAPLSTRYEQASMRRVRIVNTLAGLDRPGTYVVLPQEQLLLAWPRDGAPLSLAGAGDLVTIAGAHDILLQGIALRGTLGTALRVTGSRNVLFADGALGQAGQSGAIVDADSRRVEIAGTFVSDTDELGVELGGGRPGADGGNALRDSILVQIGRRGGTARPVVQVKGYGQLVSGCYIHAAPAAGINIRGAGHRILGNELTDTNRETGDYGAIYTYANLSRRGSLIASNYIHDVRTLPGLRRNVGIYLDAWSSGMTIEGNLFADVGRAVWVNGGSNNQVAGNVIVRATDNAITVGDLARQWNGTAGKNVRHLRGGAGLEDDVSVLGGVAAAGGSPRDNRIGENLLLGGPAPVFSPEIAGHQSIAPQRVLAIARSGRPTLADLAVAAAARTMRIDVAALDRRARLATLRYAR